MNIPKRYHFVGQFKIESGKIIVSDPYYKLGYIEQLEHKAKNGIWNAYVIRSKDDRIKRLIAIHSDYNLNSKCCEKVVVEVDTGQMSIVDYKHFGRNEDITDVNDCWEHWLNRHKNERWYAHCCKITLFDEKHCGIIRPGFGVVSSYGFGAGAYTIKYKTNEDGEIVKVEVIFIQ